MDSGGFTSAEYITNKNGKVIQANVGSAEGFSRYSFSESGYEAGQEFTPIKGWGSRYDLVRDQGNAPATMTIHCHAQSFTVPIPAGMSMRDNGAHSRCHFRDVQKAGSVSKFLRAANPPSVIRLNL